MTGISNPVEVLQQYTALRDVHQAALNLNVNALSASSPDPTHVRQGGESHSSSSSRPPAGKKVKLSTPKVTSASKRLIFQYNSRRDIPPPNRQTPTALIRDSLAGQLATRIHHNDLSDLPLAGLTVRDATWNCALSTLTVIFGEIPTKEAAIILKDMVVDILNIATPHISVRHHEYTSGLVFPHVNAISFSPHDGRPLELDAMHTLSTAINRSSHQGWLEALTGGLITEARWAPLRGSATSLLFVELSDSSTTALANTLVGTTLHFENGHRRAIPQERRQNQAPQCSMCWQFGHTAIQCRNASQSCQLCGAGHEVYHHDNFVKLHGANTYLLCCTNCFLPHQADSKDCPFYKHKNNPQWLADTYEYMSHIDQHACPSQIPGTNNLPGLDAIISSVPGQTTTVRDAQGRDVPPSLPRTNYVWQNAGSGSHPNVARPLNAARPPPIAGPSFVNSLPGTSVRNLLHPTRTLQERIDLASSTRVEEIPVNLNNQTSPQPTAKRG